MKRALIFDCDGVLGDTEQFGHLVAFNQMWKESGVPWEWSVEEYGRKLKIGGGKERMASLFSEAKFLKAWPAAPADETARKETVAAWHKRKTEIYKEIIRSGRIPARSGVRRLSEEALANGWLLAVASTSAPEAVNAVLRHAVGEATAGRFSAVLAGDVVKAKKPAPDIYLMAARELGVPPEACVVVEDSNNGVESAYAAQMQCVVTVSGYTREEDFSHASIVVTCLGDPGGEPCEVLANRSAARPVACFGTSDLEAVLSGGTAADARSAVPCNREALENSSLAAVELVVRTIAETAVANETYFCQLDSVVGDGDFGYSLARGFEKVLDGFDGFDRSSPGAFLKKIGLVIASRVGGTSGPIWGTAFLRAGAAAGAKTVLSAADVVAILRAAVAGIQSRGGAGLGDKTLLDALVPAIDRLESDLENHAGDWGVQALANAAQAAELAAAATTGMLAKRGRASYTGE
jgi:dihydroxyacetone kinase phosphoprotein-dependent L subunit